VPPMITGTTPGGLGSRKQTSSVSRHAFRTMKMRNIFYF